MRENHYVYMSKYQNCVEWAVIHTAFIPRVLPATFLTIRKVPFRGEGLPEGVLGDGTMALWAPQGAPVDAMVAAARWCAS